MILVGPKGVEISYTLRFEFKATNNQAEYEAFITGLKLALVVHADKVKIQIDSQLVANYLNENFQARDEKIKAYL